MSVMNTLRRLDDKHLGTQRQHAKAARGLPGLLGVAFVLQGVATFTDIQVLDGAVFVLLAGALSSVAMLGSRASRG